MYTGIIHLYIKMLVSAQHRPLLTVLRIESNFSSLHVIVPPYMENSPQFRFSCIDNDSPFKEGGSFPPKQTAVFFAAQKTKFCYHK